MSKSLADLRAEGESLAERAITVCLKPELVAEVQALSERLATVPTSTSVATDDEAKVPGRMAKPADPEADEIHKRLTEVLAEMAEYEGELRLRALPDGEWRIWADAHPARAKDEPGHQRDQEVTAGYCDADALIENLGTFAHSWNGDTLADGDWDVIAGRMSGPDKKSAAQQVIAMQEQIADFMQWRRDLSAILNRYAASVSRTNSASAPAASTAGSRRPAKKAATKKATASR